MIILVQNIQPFIFAMSCSSAKFSAFIHNNRFFAYISNY